MKVGAHELRYADLCGDILKMGTYDLNERTKIGTRRLPCQYFKVNYGVVNTPILSAKKVMWKSAIEEILWIMQKGSNNINDLRPKIWDEWADENGSIGKAYGYQISTYHQVEKLLSTLKEDPSSRRGVLNLWNPADLDEMNLVPCCFSSTWTIVRGRLHCMLTQRSADMMLGVPFNTFQYYALQMMFARHLGVKVGSLFHTMADAHIYENHMEGASEYLRRVTLMADIFFYRDVDKILNMTYDDPHFKKVTNHELYFKDQEELSQTQEVVKTFVDQGGMKETPTLRLATDKTNFWDFTIDDFVMENYHPMPMIHFDVAV